MNERYRWNEEEERHRAERARRERGPGSVGGPDLSGRDYYGVSGPERNPRANRAWEGREPVCHLRPQPLLHANLHARAAGLVHHSDRAGIRAHETSRAAFPDSASSGVQARFATARGSRFSLTVAGAAQASGLRCPYLFPV